MWLVKVVSDFRFNLKSIDINIFLYRAVFVFSFHSTMKKKKKILMLIIIVRPLWVGKGIHRLVVTIRIRVTPSSFFWFMFLNPIYMFIEI